MATLFESAIKQFFDLGFLDILLFVLFSAIFYAILKKSKVLSESAALNGTVAIIAAFFIFAYPVVTGFGSIVVNISIYFAQLTIWILVLLFAFLLSSFFYPSLMDQVKKLFERRTTLWVMFALAFTFVITSGLLSVLYQVPSKPGQAGPPQDIIIFVAGIFIFVVMLLIAASTVKGED